MPYQNNLAYNPGEEADFCRKPESIAHRYSPSRDEVLFQEARKIGENSTELSALLANVQLLKEDTL